MAMVLAVAAVYLARRYNAEQLYLPLAFVIVPGCFPIGLLAAILLWQRSSVFADVRMDRDHSRLIVNAHPEFVAAAADRQLP